MKTSYQHIIYSISYNTKAAQKKIITHINSLENEKGNVTHADPLLEIQRGWKLMRCMAHINFHDENWRGLRTIAVARITRSTFRAPRTWITKSNPKLACRFLACFWFNVQEGSAPWMKCQGVGSPNPCDQYDCILSRHPRSDFYQF